MKWADALKASPNKKATRKQTDGDEDYDGEPNVILWDPKFPKAPKLFRAIRDEAWERIPLKEAKKYEDWEPA